MGKVREVFSDSGTGLRETHCGIGNVRYSTTGSSCVENAGPFIVGGSPESIAIAHNGDLVNGKELRALYQDELHSDTDSEAMALLLLHAEGQNLRERMLSAFPRIRGSYSLVI